MFNYPYMQPSFQPHPEIIHINGENGARAYNLPPNASALLLDDTAPLVWLAQTDGAGYKTVTPYKIEEYRPTTTNDLEARIRRLEELLYEPNNEQAEPAKQRPVTNGTHKVRPERGVRRDDENEPAVPTVL